MRWLVAFSIILATVLSASAEDWTTADGKQYKNVTVLDQEDDGVRITYDGGVGKIPYYELTPELQKRFGQDLETLEAKKKAADKALAEALRNATAAEQKRQQDAAADQQMQPTPPPPTFAPAQPAPISPQAATATPAQKKQQDDEAAKARAAAAAAAASAPAQPVQPVDNSIPTPEVHAIYKPNAESANGVPSYPGSKYSYNQSLDVCYLDSFSANVLPDAAPNAPGEGTCLIFRIITDGFQPQQPEKMEGIFLSVSTTRKLNDKRDVNFVVDGKQLPVDKADDKNNDLLMIPGKIVESVYFTLTPEEAKSVLSAKSVKVAIGGVSYTLDPSSLSVFQKYFADVDQLPPATSNILRTCYKFFAHLPSLVSMISATCTYIILGGFSLVAIVFVYAFILGLIRFIKM